MNYELFLICFLGHYFAHVIKVTVTQMLNPVYESQL